MLDRCTLYGMTEKHAYYKAIRHQIEQAEGGIRHKIWLHGHLRPQEMTGAERTFLYNDDQTDSNEAETELWFLNHVPYWIVQQSLVAS